MITWVNFRPVYAYVMVLCFMCMCISPLLSFYAIMHWLYPCFGVFISILICIVAYLYVKVFYHVAVSCKLIVPIMIVVLYFANLLTYVVLFVRASTYG